jgi:phosphatidylserine decarboxylase
VGAGAAVVLLLVVLVVLRVLPASPLVLAPIVGLLVVVVFFAQFFRDPERPIGEGIVSAADGRVRAVERVGDRLLVSVFMNISNVHVNRAPIGGRVLAVASSGEAFRPAYRPDAHHNVQRAYRLETEIGSVEIVQLTGIVARRLVSFVGPGHLLERGQRFGMIVLGSRVDVYLPADRVDAAVRVGDRVTAGTTTIARPRA